MTMLILNYSSSLTVKTCSPRFVPVVNDSIVAQWARVWICNSLLVYADVYRTKGTDVVPQEEMMLLKDGE